MAGVPCFDVDDRLWGVRARLHRWRHVSRARTPAQDPQITFDFLSPAAADDVGHRDNATALVRVCALYFGSGQRFFCWSSLAAGADDLCFWRLDSLCRNLARKIFAPARAETRGRFMHYWI